MEPLKEMFNRPFYEKLGDAFARADKNFHAGKFVQAVTKNIEPLSLNQRMRNTSVVLQQQLPTDFRKATAIMKKVIPQLNGGYTNLLFPDYVGLYGHTDFEAAMDALHFFTQYGSSEFAIREFLKRDFAKTIRVMKTWAADKNHHVRRLASEGSRPRLPWSFKLDTVIKNPAVTQPILERLNADPELYVRKSVANHLNDISKDHPEYMIGMLGAWDKKNAHTAWIIKHASRTLIKKGNTQSLALFGFDKNIKVAVENLRITKPKLKLGERLEFAFDVVSQKSTVQKLVIDYAIHYVKKSGETAPKVFKLRETELAPRQRISIYKQQLMADFTTRKHNAGKHTVEILINGKSLATAVFNLRLK